MISINEYNKLIQGIQELYLSVKIRKSSEIDQFNEEALHKERLNLQRTPPMTLLGYIKSSIEIIINLKVQERINDYIEDSKVNELSKSQFSLEQSLERQRTEELIRHLEAEIRKKAQREMKLKMKIEALESKLISCTNYSKEALNNTNLNSNSLTGLTGLTDEDSMKHSENDKRQIQVDFEKKVNAIEHEHSKVKIYNIDYRRALSKDKTL